jgi:hypothetical protein
VNYPPKDAVAYLLRVHGLKRSTRTLANLRSTGGGPEYYRTGPTEVLYPSVALDKWAREQLGPLVRHTAAERGLGRDLSTMDKARAAKEEQT